MGLPIQCLQQLQIVANHSEADVSIFIPLACILIWIQILVAKRDLGALAAMCSL